MELIKNNESTLTLIEQISKLVTIYLQESGSAKVTHLHEFILEQIEPPLLEAVMSHCRYNQRRASQVLGISRGTCRRKLIQYFDDRYCGNRKQE